MFFSKLWHYLVGYVVIVFEGKSPERFINMCTNKNVYIWNIKKKADELNTARISIQDFKKIRPIVRKTKIKVRVHKKRGIPFIINKYRNRKFFLLGGVAMFALIIYILSLFIWSVEVIGNKNIPLDIIVKNLNEVGVKVGALRTNLNSKYLKNEMLLRMKELAWIKVDLTGTKVIVEVVESVIAPDVISNDEPCDIVASASGIVNKIIVHEGVQKAFLNETVKEGDLLVSGLEQSKYGDVRYVHALAEIELRTWYQDEMILQKNSSENISENVLVQDGKEILLDNLEKTFLKGVEIIDIKTYTDIREEGIVLKVVVECIQNGVKKRKITA